MKISKKDQTNESIAAEAAATYALLDKRTDHFAVGERVVYKNRMARVLRRPGDGSMWLWYPDGSTEIVQPYALQHEETQ